MKARAILFSAPMVRALLAGTKTQTRRVVKGWALDWLSPGNFTPEFVADPGNRACPYGVPGDRLWVREAFRFLDCFNRDSPSKVGDLCVDAGYNKPWAPTHYEADGARANWMSVGTLPGKPAAGKLRPGIHMPRWASRITLEVTEVRVERLQDISDDDLAAEGIQELIDAGVDHDGTPRDTYRTLWEALNGAGSWDANPWVWAVSFRRVGP
jgi:hypothetical protein